MKLYKKIAYFTLLLSLLNCYNTQTFAAGEYHETSDNSQAATAPSPEEQEREIQEKNRQIDQDNEIFHQTKSVETAQRREANEEAQRTTQQIADRSNDQPTTQVVFHEPTEPSTEQPLDNMIDEQNLSPERIKTLTSADFADLDMAIMDWSPEQIQAINPAELPSTSIHYLEMSNKLLDVNIGELNAGQLVNAIMLTNRGPLWTESMVAELTKTQAEAIYQVAKEASNETKAHISSHFFTKTETPEYLKSYISKDIATAPDEDKVNEQPKSKSILDHVSDAFSRAKKSLTDTLASTKKSLNDSAQRTTDSIQRGAQQVSDVTQSLRDSVNKSLNDSAQRITDSVNKVTDMFKSSAFGRWLNDQVGFINRQVDVSNAKHSATDIASKAKGPISTDLDGLEQNRFTDAMKKLSTKQKESVANTWLESRTTTYAKDKQTILNNIKATEAKIDHLNISDSDKSTLDEETRNKIETQTNDLKSSLEDYRNNLQTLTSNFAAERQVFMQDIQKTLKPNEVVIHLTSSADENHRAYEIIDMSKVDPTKSIADQIDNMTRNMQISNHINPTTNANSRISSTGLLSAYSDWVAKSIGSDISTSSSTSVIDQLDEAMQKLTGKTLSDCDPSIRQAILDKLPNDISEQYTTEQTAQGLQDAGDRMDQAKQELQKNAAVVKTMNDMNTQAQKVAKNASIMAMKPAQIKNLSSEDIANITPDTLSKLSTQQINAFTNKQLSSLSTEQVQALTNNQVPTIITRLTIPQIKDLSTEQITNLNLDATKLSSSQMIALAPKIERASIADDILTKNLTTAQQQAQFLSQLPDNISQRLSTSTIEHLINNFSNKNLIDLLKELPQEQLSDVSSQVLRNKIDSIRKTTKPGTTNTQNGITQLEAILKTRSAS